MSVALVLFDRCTIGIAAAAEGEAKRQGGGWVAGEDGCGGGIG